MPYTYDLVPKSKLALSAGAVKYTDCISAEELDTPPQWAS